MDGFRIIRRAAFTVALGIAATLPACEEEPQPLPMADTQDELAGPVPCTVDGARYPTVPGDMDVVYAGRTFYVDGNHLGHDIAYDEGTPIHPVACGIVRVYRPATGYGRLVVVVEHQLVQPMAFVNGKGEIVTVAAFLTIYGHLRQSADRNGTTGLIDIRAGDMVSPSDVIGYVDADATNGDGQEHLHLGVRLQSAEAARDTDTSWFRGYDGSPSQRAWFADPAPFLSTLLDGVVPTRWHPDGTAVIGTDGTAWMVDDEGRRHEIPPQVFAQERFGDLAVRVSDQELACLAPSTAYVSSRQGARVMKFDDASTVYEYADFGDGGWRKTFITYDAFRSWGWTDADVAVWPSGQRAAFFAETEDWGFRTMRDGSLVKSDASSEVSVVSGGRRLPIFDWSTFIALGYREERIVVIPDDVIELVAGPRGPLVTADLVRMCLHPSSCVDDCPSSVPGGGGVGGDDAGAGGIGSGGSGPTSPDGGSGVHPAADVPSGMIEFRYDGPVLPGLNVFQGMWDPPGPVFHDWTSSTSALCQDAYSGDGVLECLLDMPSGTTGFLFTVRLPDGRWWGDMSYDSTGGHGDTIGTVTLTGPGGDIPYTLVSNGTGPLYMNGSVPVVP